MPKSASQVVLVAGCNSPFMSLAEYLTALFVLAMFCLVGENPTRSVHAFYGSEGLCSYGYGYAWNEHPPPPRCTLFQNPAITEIPEPVRKVGTDRKLEHSRTVHICTSSTYMEQLESLPIPCHTHNKCPMRISLTDVCGTIFPYRSVRAVRFCILVRSNGDNNLSFQM